MSPDFFKQKFFSRLLLLLGSFLLFLVTEKNEPTRITYWLIRMVAPSPYSLLRRWLSVISPQKYTEEHKKNKKAPVFSFYSLRIIFHDVSSAWLDSLYRIVWYNMFNKKRAICNRAASSSVEHILF